MIKLDEIYDAPFDQTRFEPLLARIVESLGAQAGFLAWSDQTSRAGFQVQVGNDPAYMQSYLETYGALDVLRPHLQGYGEGAVHCAYDLLQDEEVRASRFYREWLAPQGLVDNMVVNIIKRPEIFAHLAILRRAPAEPFGPAEIATLEALLPHLRRMVLLQSRVIRQADLVAGYRQAATSTRDNLLLLDERLTVLDVNAELAQLAGLTIGEPVGRSAFGRVVAAAIEQGRPLLAEIAGGDGGVPVRLLCHAQAVQHARFGDFAGGPGVTHAVHATRIDHPWPLALPLIADLYGLTPMELRVLEDALAHSDTAGLADRLGISRPTTRTHLHRIYQKTGTSGFADLCLFAHRFILPRALGAEK